jgi:hypothetical protein
VSVIFAVNLTRADHTRRYSIQPLAESGWEVRLEEDRLLTHRACYRDWHRVERARAVFRLQVLELTTRGWAVTEG